MFLMFLPAKALKAIPIQVEKFDGDKPYDHHDQGYQRSAENNRARRFARYLEAPRAASPTAIMLNDRDSQSKYDPVEGALTFDTEKGPIFNFDGQHRQLGYEFRLDGDESFAEFPIPVVMTRGMDKLTEMMQFQTINSTAKGVATGLVNAILANLHATRGDEAIDASAHRNVVCYKVTEALNNDPAGPWHMLIALPNQRQWTNREIAEDPTREQTRVIKANSFVDVLRPVYDYMTMRSMASSLDSRAQEMGVVVNEFWSALKQKLPQAFERPHDYALFKSNGVGPMHLVLRHLMFKMHDGHRKYVKDEFLAMMDGSDLLNNHEFWRSDNEDGARNCSGKAGWPDLAKKIIRDLEEGAKGYATGDVPLQHIPSLHQPGTSDRPPAIRPTEVSNAPVVAEQRSNAEIRKLPINVTPGDIRQNLLKLTQHINRGRIRVGEELVIEAFPSGERFQTVVSDKGKKLRARGEIARFYRDAKINPDDYVLLTEETPGRWTLKKAPPGEYSRYA
jgi:DGQHR domain-containing protein